MRWVNDTLPPRARARWLLITMRLSAISFAGTARTLVAVGTESDASMFFAIAVAAPRSCLESGSASLAWGLAAGAAFAGAVAVGLGAGFAGALAAGFGGAADACFA